MNRTMVRLAHGSSPLTLPEPDDPPPPYDARVPAPIELPQAEGGRPERVDAARNRAAILDSLFFTVAP